MLGFGKSTEVLTTRGIEEALLEGIATIHPDEEIWIITPYSTMDKMGSVRRSLTEACKKGGKVKFVVRDEPEQVQSALKGLKQARELGLELFALHRLHAKLYWFQGTFGIVTSANLVDGSFEASTELGILVDGGSLHAELKDWIEKEIEPQMRPVTGLEEKSSPKGSFKPKSPNNGKPHASNQGHCIRCGKGIPSNLEKPYCLPHFKSWANYSNPQYAEKFCHICGAEAKTSMEKPRCYRCFKCADRDLI